VQGIVAESQRRIGPASHKTPFERNLLPSFADWTLEQIQQFKPDFLIPVETKGVHALDAARFSSGPLCRAGRTLSQEADRIYGVGPSNHGNNYTYCRTQTDGAAHGATRKASSQRCHCNTNDVAVC